MPLHSRYPTAPCSDCPGLTSCLDSILAWPPMSPCTLGRLSVLSRNFWLTCCSFQVLVPCGLVYSISIKHDPESIWRKSFAHAAASLVRDKEMLNPPSWWRHQSYARSLRSILWNGASGAGNGGSRIVQRSWTGMQLQQRHQRTPWGALKQTCPTEISWVRQGGWTFVPHIE